MAKLIKQRVKKEKDEFFSRLSSYVTKAHEKHKNLIDQITVIEDENEDEEIPKKKRSRKNKEESSDDVPKRKKGQKIERKKSVEREEPKEVKKKGSKKKEDIKSAPSIPNDSDDLDDDVPKKPPADTKRERRRSKGKIDSDDEQPEKPVSSKLKGRTSSSDKVDKIQKAAPEQNKSSDEDSDNNEEKAKESPPRKKVMAKRSFPFPKAVQEQARTKKKVEEPKKPDEEPKKAENARKSSGPTKKTSVPSKKTEDISEEHVFTKPELPKKRKEPVVEEPKIRKAAKPEPKPRKIVEPIRFSKPVVSSTKKVSQAVKKEKKETEKAYPCEGKKRSDLLREFNCYQDPTLDMSIFDLLREFAHERMPDRKNYEGKLYPCDFARCPFNICYDTPMSSYYETAREDWQESRLEKYATEQLRRERCVHCKKLLGDTTETWEKVIGCNSRYCSLDCLYALVIKAKKAIRKPDGLVPMLNLATGESVTCGVFLRELPSFLCLSPFWLPFISDHPSEFLKPAAKPTPKKNTAQMRIPKLKPSEKVAKDAEKLDEVRSTTRKMIFDCLLQRAMALGQNKERKDLRELADNIETGLFEQSNKTTATPRYLNWRAQFLVIFREFRCKELAMKVINGTITVQKLTSLEINQLRNPVCWRNVEQKKTATALTAKNTAPKAKPALSPLDMILGDDEADTTKQHMSHTYSAKCKICQQKMIDEADRKRKELELRREREKQEKLLREEQQKQKQEKKLMKKRMAELELERASRTVKAVENGDSDSDDDEGFDYATGDGHAGFTPPPPSFIRRNANASSPPQSPSRQVEAYNQPETSENYGQNLPAEYLKLRVRERYYSRQYGDLPWNDSNLPPSERFNQWPTWSADYPLGRITIAYGDIFYTGSAVPISFVNEDSIKPFFELFPLLRVMDIMELVELREFQRYLDNFYTHKDLNDGIVSFCLVPDMEMEERCGHLFHRLREQQCVARMKTRTDDIRAVYLFSQYGNEELERTFVPPVGPRSKKPVGMHMLILIVVLRENLASMYPKWIRSSGQKNDPSLNQLRRATEGLVATKETFGSFLFDRDLPYEKRFEVLEREREAELLRVQQQQQQTNSPKVREVFDHEAFGREAFESKTLVAPSDLDERDDSWRKVGDTDERFVREEPTQTVTQAQPEDNEIRSPSPEVNEEDADAGESYSEESTRKIYEAIQAAPRIHEIKLQIAEYMNDPGVLTEHKDHISLHVKNAIAKEKKLKRMKLMEQQAAAETTPVAEGSTAETAPVSETKKIGPMTPDTEIKPMVSEAVPPVEVVPVDVASLVAHPPPPINFLPQMPYIQPESIYTHPPMFVPTMAPPGIPMMPPMGHPGLAPVFNAFVPPPPVPMPMGMPMPMQMPMPMPIPMSMPLLSGEIAPIPPEWMMVPVDIPQLPQSYEMHCFKRTEDDREEMHKIMNEQCKVYEQEQRMKTIPKNSVNIMSQKLNKHTPHSVKLWHAKELSRNTKITVDEAMLIIDRRIAQEDGKRGADGSQDDQPSSSSIRAPVPLMANAYNPAPSFNSSANAEEQPRQRKRGDIAKSEEPEEIEKKKKKRGKRGGQKLRERRRLLNEERLFSELFEQAKQEVESDLQKFVFVH